MPKPFLQINRLRHNDLDSAVDLIRHCIDVAVQRCEEVDLTDVEWGLWRPEGKHADHYWLTEGYRSAQHWGQAEDIGITDPDLRNAIARMNAANITIDRVMLLAEMDMYGTSEANHTQLVRIHSASAHAPGTPMSLFQAGVGRTRLQSNRVRMFKARVSGDLFNQIEIWVETGRDDGVWEDLSDSAEAMGWKASRYFAYYGSKMER